MYKTIVTRCVVLWCLYSSVLPLEKMSMTMRRAEISDQKMSGSGYSYNAEDGSSHKPQEFSFELVGVGDKDAFEILKDMGYDSVTEASVNQPTFAPLATFSDVTFPPLPPFPLPYENVPAIPASTTKAPISKPGPFTVNNNKQTPTVQDVKPSNSRPNPSRPENYPIYPYASGYDHPKKQEENSFIKTAGKIYNDFLKWKFGDKLDKGYNVVDEYSKGVKGKFNNQYAKGYYDNTGGNKNSFYDKGTQFNGDVAGGAIVLGGALGEKEFHDKGSKTTGYHKMYHKDDYNKQHKFYDKADRKGHFVKYGDFQATKDQAAGQWVDGVLHAERNGENKYGIKDQSDKGKFEDTSKGFNREDGQEGFYQDYAGYQRKAGRDKENENGFSERNS
ncbi:uncharacterized protein [Euwallacea fornicatus]|uniref:uncharacterized protein n=1 Tax=Euwallacea fornicatus TaxID=995702 RepID=UPI003390763A